MSNLKAVIDARQAVQHVADLALPIEAPRASWPTLIERACAEIHSEALAIELRAIAAALRVDGYGALCDVLRECVEASQPMAQMHATENARAVLRRVGGAA